MAQHPHDDSDQTDRDSGYVLPRRDYNTMPLPRNNNDDAANLIRTKLDKIYATEPDAFEEELKSEAAPHPSKHQQFMNQLNESGKDLAQVQTEWHNYYVNLPDEEKHAVWQEFYSSNEQSKHPHVSQQPAPEPTEHMAEIRSHINALDQDSKQQREDRRSVSELQHEIHYNARKKLTKKQHAQSLAFGLGVGALVVIFILFGFFNEVLLAPFVQPARVQAATPLIVSANTAAPSQDPQVIIPKINVQIPIQFDISSTDEATMQSELEKGVAHYPTTASPGQNGNAAYFGHSSNNIFNKGKYKFAFVLLHELVNGDTFYITQSGKLYAYKVFETKVVEPNQVDVLNPIEGHTATATLITCDPPGTSLHRLVVIGDQISPDPSSNDAASNTNNVPKNTTKLSGNSPTLWSQLLGKTVVRIGLGVAAFVAIIIGLRRLNRQHRL